MGWVYEHVMMLAGGSAAMRIRNNFFNEAKLQTVNLQRSIQFDEF